MMADERQIPTTASNSSTKIPMSSVLDGNMPACKSPTVATSGQGTSASNDIKECAKQKRTEGQTGQVTPTSPLERLVGGRFATGEEARSYIEEQATRQRIKLKLRRNTPQDTMLIARCMGLLDSANAHAPQGAAPEKRGKKVDCRYEIFIRYSYAEQRWIVKEGSTQHNHPETGSQHTGISQHNMANQDNVDPGAPMEISTKGPPLADSVAKVQATLREAQCAYRTARAAETTLQQEREDIVSQLHALSVPNHDLRPITDPIEDDFLAIEQKRRVMNMLYDTVEQEVRAAGMAIRDTWNDIVWLQTRIGILLEAANVIGSQAQQPDSRVGPGDGDGSDLQVLEDSQQIVQSLIGSMEADIAGLRKQLRASDATAVSLRQTYRAVETQFHGQQKKLLAMREQLKLLRYAEAIVHSSTKNGHPEPK